MKRLLDEHSSLSRELVSFPPDADVVGCRCLFTVKYKPDGSIDRYKARLCARRRESRVRIAVVNRTLCEMFRGKKYYQHAPEYEALP
jgi:hypothetical protein